MRMKQFKTGLADAAAALLTWLFGIVYEYFGFGVTSPFMHLAFLIPLCLGAVPHLLAALLWKSLPLGAAGACFLQGAIASFTVGALFRGALDIYGTSSPLTAGYLFIGLFCLLMVCLSLVMHRRQGAMAS